MWFGININPRHPVGQPVNKNLLKDTGWIRMVFQAASAWQTTEEAIEYYDLIVNQYHQIGLRVLFVLNQETFWGHGPWEHGGWDAYAVNFGIECDKIALHFKQYKVAYEIWNEEDIEGESSIFVPPEEYAKILYESCRAIRNVVPDAQITFGGLASGSGKGVSYVNRVKNSPQFNGSLPVTSISIHPYGKWPPVFDSPPNWGGWFGPLEDIDVYDAAFPNMPIWITEYGISEKINFPPEQYSMVAKYMKGVFDFIQDEFSHRVSMLIWFAWSDGMRQAGIVDGQQNPKGAVYRQYFELAERAKSIAPSNGAMIGILCRTNRELSIYRDPGIQKNPIFVTQQNARLLALDNADTLVDTIGKKNNWLKVRAENGVEGWVDAQGLIIDKTLLHPTANLNIRREGDLYQPILTTVKRGVPLVALDDVNDVITKVGRNNEWLKVKGPNDTLGYSAAWFLTLGDTPITTQDVSNAELIDAIRGSLESVSVTNNEIVSVGEAIDANITTVVLTPTAGLNIRHQPDATLNNVFATIRPGIRVTVVEDPQSALDTLGQKGWIKVRLPDKRVGWMAAKYLRRLSEEELSLPNRMTTPVPSARLELVITTNNTPIHSGPHVDFAEVSRLDTSYPIKALEVSSSVKAKLNDGGDNWLRVEVSQDIQGWVSVGAIDIADSANDNEQPLVQSNVRSTRITNQEVGSLPGNTEEGKIRALSFDHEPYFVRLPVSQPETIANFSGFGPNNFSEWKKGRDAYKNLCQLHIGLDFGIPIGTSLCAVDWGVIVYVGHGNKGYRSLPFNVIVRHGSYVLLYGHMKPVENNRLQELYPYKKGDIVKPGDPLGPSWTAFDYPHLHLEIRRINPIYISKLRKEASQQHPNNFDQQSQLMNNQFNIRGWQPMDDHWVNPALFFDPPIEDYWDKYSWNHAAGHTQDKDKNGYPDTIKLATSSQPNAYDLYSVSSIPPGDPFSFWQGSISS